MKNSTRWLCSLLALSLLACGEDPLPKPKAMLRLDYPPQAYRVMEADCPFAFEYSQGAHLEEKEDCNMVLHYPAMKGSVFITYKPVEGNLKELLSDAQKLAYEHVIKADAIPEQEFVNPEKKVYGMFYEVTGDAASQSQFYLTDSTRHFVTGSLYFYAKPNYDSILPAAVYLQNDIRRIMESLSWK